MEKLEELNLVELKEEELVETEGGLLLAATLITISLILLTASDAH